MPARTRKVTELTDEAVVSCHACPFLGRINLVIEVHCLVSLEFAAGRKGGHLLVDSRDCLIFLAVLGASTLRFMLLVLGIDDLDSKGVFSPIVLGLSSGPLARGRHSSGVL
jgi:hypothetical protein